MWHSRMFDSPFNLKTYCSNSRSLPTKLLNYDPLPLLGIAPQASSSASFGQPL